MYQEEVLNDGRPLVLFEEIFKTDAQAPVCISSIRISGLRLIVLKTSGRVEN